MTDDLSRVLADIDSLLPPGAPSTPDSSGERWEAEAMRWQPVDHDHHPEQPAPDPLRRYVHDRAVIDRLLDLYPNAHGWVAPGVGRMDLAATDEVRELAAAPSEAVYDIADFDRHFPNPDTTPVPPPPARRASQPRP